MMRLAIFIAVQDMFDILPQPCSMACWPAVLGEPVCPKADLLSSPWNGFLAGLSASWGKSAPASIPILNFWIIAMLFKIIDNFFGTFGS